jgi:serine/threonine-protein kinase
MGRRLEGPHLLGTVFGHYRVTRKLGQGGVGDVWKAIDLSLDREVALKVLRLDHAAQPEVVARFRAEALALAKLNHPHIAAIYGFHVEDACPFMVMEYVEGQTLDTVVRASGRMELARALRLFYQVLDAMQHAHEQGIVHRDLKASNVMLSQLGVVKVLDFGIARRLGSVHLTRGTHGVGTPAWMAPEQIRAEEADARTDVYALGLLLYWLVAARLPFEGHSEFAVQRAHLEQEPASPRVYAPDLPDAVEKAILRALAKDRPQRYANVAELRCELGDRRERRRTGAFRLDVPLDALPALEADEECTLVTGSAGRASPAPASGDVPTRILAEPPDDEREAAGGGAIGRGERREVAAAPGHGSGREVASAPRGGSPVGKTTRPAPGAGRRPLAWAAVALLAACVLLGVWASAPREQLDRRSAPRPSPVTAQGFPTAADAATTPGSATAAGAAPSKSAATAARAAARKQRSPRAESEDGWVIRRE